MTVRFTISLPDDDARVLDAYVQEHGLGGRSAGVQAAIRMLRGVGIELEYAEAFADAGANDDWESSVT